MPPNKTCQAVQWDKERAEFIVRLSENAYRRYEYRAQNQWRVSTALWTGLGAAIGLIITSNLILTFMIRIGSIVICLALVMLYYFWNQWIRTQNARDWGTHLYWESALEKMIGIELPEPLQSRVRFGKEAAIQAKHPWYKNTPAATRFSITLLFVVLFLLALWGK
ncbi:MAG: hypothetical protein DYG89_43580 [Caldilinea sp. CFX5]|nr:hypothetical protein [Caldilinea sp. CFX5]